MTSCRRREEKLGFHKSLSWGKSLPAKQQLMVDCEALSLKVLADHDIVINSLEQSVC